MIKVELHDRSDNLVKVLSKAKNAAYHPVLNQDGSGTFLIHRADPDFTTYNVAFGGIDGYIVHLLRRGPYEATFTDRFAFVVEACVGTLGQQEDAGAWWRISGRGTLCLLEDRIVFPPGYDGTNQSTITAQFQTYAAAPGGRIMAGEIDRSNPRFALALTHSKDTLGGNYSAAVLADSPKAYWRLNQVSGNFVDSSGNAHTATPVGGPTYGVAGATSDGDKAITLNGTTQYANIVDHADFVTPGAVEAWINCPTVAQGVASILERLDAAGLGGWLFGFVDNIGHLWFRVTTSGATSAIVSALPITPGVWHHVVGTWNGSSLNLYIDGALAAAPVATTGTIQSPGTPLVQMGTWIGNNFINGSLDEVAFYPSALSASRVLTHYIAGTSYTSQSTVQQTAQFHFDNLRTVHDYLVANGMDGQMVGLDYQALDHRGTDKSATVTVAMAAQDSLLGVTLERDATKVANYVVAQGIGEGTNATILSASDSASIASLRRREAYLAANQDSDPNQIALRAASAVTQLKAADQRITTRFIDSPHTQLYRDFDLGDTIQCVVQPIGLSTKYRCVGITVTDQDSEVEDCALDLNSIRQEYLLKLATGAALTSTGLGVVTRLPPIIEQYIAASTVTPSNQTFTPSSLSDWHVVAGTPAVLTLIRSSRFKVFYNIAAKTAGAVGQIAYARLHIVGQGTANSSIFDKNNTGWTNGMGWSQFQLPAGVYTVQLEVSADSGQTVTVTQGNLDCYLLGG